MFILFLLNSNNLDKKYVWHPYTQMKLWNRSNNIVIESGNGFSFVDSQNKRYLMALVICGVMFGDTIGQK